MIKSHDFDYLYHSHLEHLLYAPGMEQFNYSFELERIDPTKLPVVKSKARKFNLEYAKAFADFTVGGGPVPEAVLKHRPDAKDFIEEVEGRNPAYGPRITKQFWGVVNELQAIPESRRATIMILDEEDQKIRQWKRARPASKVEYPCTMALTFFIRQRRLNLHASMRSSNACTTICYDVFNFAVLLCEMSDQLGEMPGSLFWNAVNSHIVPREVQLAHSIMAEYRERRASKSAGSITL